MANQFVFKPTCFDSQFYEEGKSVESIQPPVGLNIPPPAAQSENSNYIVRLSDGSDGTPFDFAIRRRSSNKIMYSQNL